MMAETGHKAFHGKMARGGFGHREEGLMENLYSITIII